MSRVAFTIVLNGEHHLRHNDYYENMIPHFDMWVFAEGVSLSTGSTSWCNSMDDAYHDNGRSVDGTIDYLKYLKHKYPDKVKILIPSKSFWKNKDEQVNECIKKIREGVSEAYLWQMDVDEQWTINNIEYVEQSMRTANVKAVSVNCNHFVGEGLIANGGNWGSDAEWRRCWDWKGEDFISHEPPVLNGANTSFIYIRQRLFNHYAYYFEKDVMFKSKWYGGHQGVYDGWKALKNVEEFPIDGSVLFGHGNYQFSINKR